MDLLLPGIAAYVLLQLGIGVLVSRRVATEDDYLLAGRRMGPLLGTATLFATWFGAETCLAGAGEAYSDGLSLASAEPFAYGLCIVLMGLLFAGPLHRLRLTTLADLFRRRFSPGAERLAALLMIPTSLLWAAAQVRAFGAVLAAASDLPLPAAIGVAAAVVVVYTVCGGLLADAITDLVQGLSLLVGLAALALGIVGSMGGTTGALEALDGAALHWLPEGLSSMGLAEAWAVPVLGSVVAQELVTRVSAARSATVARRSACLAGILYMLVGLVPVTLGLLGPLLVPGLEDGERILPELALRHLSPLAATLFAGALVSAILSTVDSTLLVSASLLAHNVVQPLRPAMSEAGKVRLARSAVALFGLLAFALALVSEGVSALVELASALGSAGILVLVVMGLFTRLGGAASAYAALLGGLAAWLLGELLEAPTPFLLSLGAALAGYLLFARSGPAPGSLLAAGPDDLAGAPALLAVPVEDERRT